MTHPNRVRMSKLTLGLLAALATAPAFAQSTSAGLGGIVTDAGGQPVAGAEVTITHVESGTISRAGMRSGSRGALRRPKPRSIRTFPPMASLIHARG